MHDSCRMFFFEGTGCSIICCRIQYGISCLILASGRLPLFTYYFTANLAVVVISRDKYMTQISDYVGVPSFGNHR